MDSIFAVLSKNKQLKAFLQQMDTEKILSKNWDFIFDALANQLHFKYFKNGVVFVSSENPMWVTEINYFEEKFKDKMNQLLPKPIVKGIKVLVSAEEISTYKRSSIVNKHTFD